MWQMVPSLLDALTLRDVSSFLVGPILMIAGGVLLVPTSTRRNGWMFVYAGAVQFTTIIVAHLLRPMIGRLPPGEGIAGMDKWLAGGASFPAGQTAFYAGLFFPLMLIAPRWTFLFAIPLLFIAAAQVLGRTHCLSDAAAALGIAALVSGGLAFILRRANEF